MGTHRTPMPAAARSWTWPRPWTKGPAFRLLLMLAMFTPALAADRAGDRQVTTADAHAGRSGDLLWYFDSSQGHIGFAIEAVGVLTFTGHFQRFGGGVFVDRTTGQARVRLAIDATSLTMNSNRYQNLARSADFFAIEQHPRIGFVSEPFPVLRPPRQLRGVLQLRGVAGEVALVLDSPPCTEPVAACTVRAQGELDRRAFGMRAWRTTVSSQVSLQISLQAQSAQPAGPPIIPAPPDVGTASSH